MVLKPTNDPLEVMRRDAVEAARKLQSASEAGGTQPFQAVRKLQAQIRELAEVVAAIPISFADETVGGGFTPNGSWQTVASLTITAPDGRDSATASAAAMVTVAWSAPAGNAWPVVSARILIGGNASVAIPLARGIQDSGSSVTALASATLMSARQLTGDVTVAVQVAITGWIGDGTQSASFSNGVPQVSATATFSP